MVQEAEKQEKQRVIGSSRRIIKLGNSSAITLPRKFMEDNNLKPGDEVGIVANHILKVVPMPESR